MIGYYNSAVRYESGQPAKRRSLMVRNATTDLAALLYADRQATVQVSNPVLTDNFGNVGFYAEEGSYYFDVEGARVEFDVQPISLSGSGTPTPPHYQQTPSASWEYIHNLGIKPTISLFTDPDLSEQVYTSLEYPDLNRVIIEWPFAVSGWAYIT